MVHRWLTLQPPFLPPWGSYINNIKPIVNREPLISSTSTSSRTLHLQTSPIFYWYIWSISFLPSCPQLTNTIESPLPPTPRLPLKQLPSRPLFLQISWNPCVFSHSLFSLGQGFPSLFLLPELHLQPTIGKILTESEKNNLNIQQNYFNPPDSPLLSSQLSFPSSFSCGFSSLSCRRFFSAFLYGYSLSIIASSPMALTIISTMFITKSISNTNLSSWASKLYFQLVLMSPSGWYLKNISKTESVFHPLLIFEVTLPSAILYLSSGFWDSRQASVLYCRNTAKTSGIAFLITVWTSKKICIICVFGLIWDSCGWLCRYRLLREHWHLLFNFIFYLFVGLKLWFHCRIVVHCSTSFLAKVL